MAGEHQRVLIVGGGLGGVSTALALRRRGIDVALFEKGSKFVEVGAGLGVWFNGMRAMDELGLADTLETVGSPNDILEIRSSRGPVLLQIPSAELARKYSARAPLMIRRPELLKVLADALEDGIAQFDAKCVGYEQDESGVTARFADGREERGALLIGADGLTSDLRTQLAPGVAPEYQGYQYRRALVQRESPLSPETFSFIWGPGDRFGFSDAGGGWTYWFGVLIMPEDETDPDGPKRAALDRFERFPGFVSELIDSTPEGIDLAGGHQGPPADGHVERRQGRSPRRCRPRHRAHRRPRSG